MSSLPREAWWADQDIDRMARALWEDAIYEGRERAGSEEASWERCKQRYRRMVCVMIDALDGDLPISRNLP